MKKRVLTVCGSGVATSVMCAKKIEEYCKKNGVDVEVTATSFGQLSGDNINADVIVAVNTKLETKANIPIVSAVSLLTGIGAENTLKEIVDILKK